MILRELLEILEPTIALGGNCVKQNSFLEVLKHIKTIRYFVQSSCVQEKETEVYIIYCCLKLNNIYRKYIKTKDYIERNMKGET